MTSPFHGINLKQCLRSNEKTLKYFQTRLCCNCKRVPFSVIRDKLNQLNIYCEECCLELKIKDKVRETKEDVEYLKQLVLDCKNFCGKTFTFEDRGEFETHESECKFINTENLNLKVTSNNKINNLELQIEAHEYMKKNDNNLNEIKKNNDIEFSDIKNKINSLLENSALESLLTTECSKLNIKINEIENKIAASELNNQSIMNDNKVEIKNMNKLIDGVENKINIIKEKIDKLNILRSKESITYS